MRMRAVAGLLHARQLLGRPLQELEGYKAVVKQGGALRSGQEDQRCSLQDVWITRAGFS